VDGLIGIFGVVIGAILGGAANLVVEYFKQRSERRGAASAIAGEISAIIDVTELRGLVKYFEALPAKLRSSAPPSPPWFILDTSVDATPVIKAYVGKIGSLGGDLPRRVAHFYSLYQSVRTEIRILTAETNPISAANRIDSTLPIWYRAKREGQALIGDLLALGGTQPET
jgi:hypothetical protein